MQSTLRSVFLVLPPPIGLNAFKVGRADTVLQPVPAPAPVPVVAPIPVPVAASYVPPSPVAVPPIVPPPPPPRPVPAVIPVYPPQPVVPAVVPALIREVAPPVIPYPGPDPAIVDGFYGAPFQYPFGQRFYGLAAVPSHVDENIRFPGVKVPVPSVPLRKN